MKPEELKTGHTYVITLYFNPEHGIFLENRKGFLNHEGKLRDAKETYYAFYILEKRSLSYFHEEEIHDHVRKL